MKTKIYFEMIKVKDLIKATKIYGNLTNICVSADFHSRKTMLFKKPCKRRTAFT